MADMNKILGQILGSGFAGGLAGGLAGSMLTSKKGRKMGKKALKIGGVAAVGALAYGAFQRYQGGKENPAPAATPLPTASQESLQPAPFGSAFMPAVNDQGGQAQLGLTLVRAMMAAARADGRLDAKESQAIFQRIESLELTPDIKAMLVEEMGKPVDIDAIVQSATTPEVAAEIYIASLLAIDVDTVEEQSYLGMLAARMRLSQDLVSELHRQVDTQVATV
jgi:uncharacterized membrane protein YebE (DUF533 family)